MRAPSSRREYQRRINRVIDYVQAHLDGDLTLERLAEVAAFSPFHFHRVFAAITGETLSDFIRRVRLERAAGALISLPETSVLEIALRYGFSSAATFARAFKAHFGMSATQWRSDGAGPWRKAQAGRGKSDRSKPKADRNLHQAERKNRKASVEPIGHRGQPREDRDAGRDKRNSTIPDCLHASFRTIRHEGRHLRTLDGSLALDTPPRSAAAGDADGRDRPRCAGYRRAGQIALRRWTNRR